MAGMPRSGSTLLCSILNQHPKIYASGTSPLATVMWNVQETILNSPEYQAYHEPEALNNSVNSILYNFYSYHNTENVIDKNRMWGTPGNLNLMINYSNSKPKVICTVRPLLEILSSYINLIKNSQSILEVKNVNENYESLCDYLMSYDGEIYNSMWSLKNITESGLVDYLVVPYSQLVSEKEKTINQILDFLDVDQYSFNFNNIKNINEGYANSSDIKYHKIRPEVSLSHTDINDILSDRIIKKYEHHGLPILNIEKIERSKSD